MFFRRFFLLAFATVAAFAQSQEPLNPPVPLAGKEAGKMSPGEIATEWAKARTAQDLGLDPVAITIYTRLLEQPNADRAGLSLALATVLLDDGKPAEAERVLQNSPGPQTAAWHLRAGLAAALLKKPSQARAEFDAIEANKSELSKADLAWFQFLQALLTHLTTPGEAGWGRANLFYQEGLNALNVLDGAPNEVAKTTFQLALERTRLRLGTMTDADVERTRAMVRRPRGVEDGYKAAVLLASMLDIQGKKAEGIAVLQDQLRAIGQLRTITTAQKIWIDEFRFKLGVIAGATEVQGRNALIQLLETGVDANRQRWGLHLLSQASQAGPARVQFRAELDKLIGATPAHPILDELYLLRAQLALGTKTAEGYALADADANALRLQFPNSPLVAYSYWVSAQSAWEQRRFTFAASFGAKARDIWPLPATRAELGVFVAEAWFRAGKLARADGAGGAGGATNFRNAADAYAAALTDPPANMAAGLMFQRVLSELEAGAPEQAQGLLDTFARNPAFDLATRWQAEWNLARAFQAAGKTREAFTRVGALLAAEGAAKTVLQPTLRAQMAWLQARLSFDLEPSDETLAFIDKLDRSLEGVEPTVTTDIRSTGLLLKAQTNFALKRDEAGLEALELLRKTFEKTSAAIYSYMVEAEYYAQRGDVAKAQTLLTKLAADFPESEYAPHALYLAALHAERRGGQENYTEAYQRIEGLIALLEKYPPKDPANDLVFAARMKQGDLLRRLNQFSQAQDTYQSLIHNPSYSQHADRFYAQLALAQSINAQSANDPHTAAESIFENLMVGVEVPVDVRAEAGFNYGEIFARRGDTKKALEIWWSALNGFLLDRVKAAELGATGRHWMARTLRSMADVFEAQGRLEEAKKAWTLLLESNLGFNELARQKLAQPNVVERDR
jgi:cellulose synthase operon protein C